MHPVFLFATILVIGLALGAVVEARYGTKMHLRIAHLERNVESQFELAKLRTQRLDDAVYSEIKDLHQKAEDLHKKAEFIADSAAEHVEDEVAKVRSEVESAVDRLKGRRKRNG
jgi:hypothetical protein